jgi:hypothetical protein
MAAYVRSFAIERPKPVNDGVIAPTSAMTKVKDHAGHCRQTE